MKNKIIIFVILAVLAAGVAFADHPDGKWGIGIMGGYYGSWDSGGNNHAAVSLKAPMLPVFWAVNLGFGSGYFNAGVSGDYYLIDSSLFSGINLHWFIGLGAWMTFGLGDYSYLAFGARIPLGLSLQPVDLLEIFLDVAPSLGIFISPDIHFPAGGWPLEIGIRLWF